MNIAVCDDDEITLKEVSRAIKGLCPEAEIEEFDSGNKLINRDKRFDIIILDIDMPEMNGMDTAYYLRSKDRTDCIIFLTGHIEFMQKAFEVRAFRYLSKPLDIDKLKKALNDVQNDMFKNVSIMIMTNNNVVILNIADIVCIEAFGDGTYVYTKNDVLICKKTLRQWASELESQNFFQVHKSFIVSLKYIVKIEKGELQMSYLSSHVPVSRRNRKTLRTVIFEYIKNNANII